MAPLEKLYLLGGWDNWQPIKTSRFEFYIKRLKFPLRLYECWEKYLPKAPSRQTAVSKANRLVDEDLLLFLEGRLKQIFYMQKIETRAGPAPRLYLNHFSPDGVTLTFTITNVFQAFPSLLPVALKCQSLIPVSSAFVGWWSILWTDITPACQPSVQSECSGRCGPSTEYQVRSYLSL